MREMFSSTELLVLRFWILENQLPQLEALPLFCQAFPGGYKCDLSCPLGTGLPLASKYISWSPV